MVNFFSFAPTPFIHFGQGKISTLPDLLNKYGKNVLIITGASSFLKTQHWAQLQEKFHEKEIIFFQSGISKEPSPTLVDETVNNFREKKIDAVIAIGGGSVLDAGKAVSAMLPCRDSVKNYLEGVGTKIHDGRKIPFIAIPTTSGTGSEATKNSVLSEVGPDGYKKSLRHDNFVPNVAIVDPNLSVNCAAGITASSGMDAFTQLLESYLSTNASKMTDSLAEEGLKCVKKSLIKVCEDGSNIEARTDMAYASMVSGITLANAPLGVVHGYASAIGGYFDIPHGIICGTLMGAANRVTVRRIRNSEGVEWALNKYARVGEIFSEETGKTKDYYIDYLLNLIDQWTDKLKIPWLSEYGICVNHFEKIANRTESKCNPVKLNQEELLEILAMRT